MSRQQLDKENYCIQYDHGKKWQVTWSENIYLELQQELSNLIISNEVKWYVITSPAFILSKFYNILWKIMLFLKCRLLC